MRAGVPAGVPWAEMAAADLAARFAASGSSSVVVGRDPGARRGGEKSEPANPPAAARVPASALMWRRLPRSTYSRVFAYTNGSTTRAKTSWNASSAAKALAKIHAAPRTDGEDEARSQANRTHATATTTTWATSRVTSTMEGRMFTWT